MKYLIHSTLLLIAFLTLACNEKEAPTYLIEFPDLVSGDNFGQKVAINDSLLFISAPGASGQNSKSGRVMIYSDADSGWVNEGELESLYRNSDMAFGSSISFDKDRVLVGAPFADSGDKEAGIAMIFERDNEGNWKQATTLEPDSVQWMAHFGSSVAISGDIAVVGAIFGKSKNGATGAAYVFEHQEDGRWKQTARLRPSKLSEGDRFGSSVALSGNTAVIGSEYNSEIAEKAGAVFIFEKKNDASWEEITKLSIGYEESYFGYDVAMSGDEIVVGAPWYSYKGGVFVYNKKANGSWEETTILTPNQKGTNSNDKFGTAVDISEDRILVGAPHGINPESDFTGQVYLFEKNEDNSWGEGKQLTLPQNLNDSYLGGSVALSSDRVVVGASTFSDYKGAVFVIEQ